MPSHVHAVVQYPDDVDGPILSNPIKQNVTRTMVPPADMDRSQVGQKVVATERRWQVRPGLKGPEGGVDKSPVSPGLNRAEPFDRPGKD